MHPDAGGEDLRGKRLSIHVLHRNLLTSIGEEAEDLAIGWTFFVEDYRWVGRAIVSFNLGVFPAGAVMVPNRTLQSRRCRWIYKGAHCGYAGALESCDKTVMGSNGCRVHFPDTTDPETGALIKGPPMRYSMFARGEDMRALRL